MRKDDILGLNLDHYPRQSFGAGDVVLSDGSETDRMLVVIDGRLGVDHAGKPLGPGEIVKSIEFFGPPWASNSAWVPASTICPASSTTIRSIRAMVDSRCAMAITVLPSITP
jgi:CRP-like cAMP-binding protein